MPKRLSDENTVTLSAKIPQALLRRVDKFQTAHKSKTRSDAVRELLERGLGAPEPAKTKDAPKCLHPITKRLGTFCADCGATVGSSKA